MAILILKLPQVGEISHELVGDVVTIGRFPGNTIQIKDQSVSGNHAELTAINGGYRIRDLESTNKTYINGLAVGEADLRGSFTIRFGMVECLLTTSPGVETADSSEWKAKLAAAEQDLNTARNEQAEAVFAREKMESELAAAHLKSEELIEKERRAMQDLQALKEQQAQREQEQEARRSEDEAKHLVELESMRRQAAELGKTLEEERAKQQEIAAERGKWQEERAVLAKRGEDEKQRADRLQAEGEAQGVVRETLRAEREEIARKLQEAEERTESVKREQEEAQNRLQQELKGMRDDLAAAKGRVEALTAETQERERTFAEMRRQHELVQTQRSELEATLQSERAASISVEGMSTEWQQRLDDMSVRLERERLEGITAKQAASQMGRRIRELEASLQFGEIEAKERELSETKARLESISQDLNAAREQAETARRNGDETAGKLGQAQQQLTATEQELQAARQRAGEASQQAEEERGHARNAGAACDEARQQVEKVASELRQLEERFAAERQTSEQASAEARQQLEAEQKCTTDLRQELANLRGELETAHAKLGAPHEAEQERSRLAAQLGELETAHENLRREKVAQEERASRLETEAADRMRGWDMEREGFGVRWGEVESRALQAEEKARNLEQNRSAFTEQLAQLEQDLITLRSAQEAIGAEKQALQGQLDERAAAVEAAVDERTRLAAKLGELEAALENSNQEKALQKEDVANRLLAWETERKEMSERIGEMEKRAQQAEESANNLSKNSGAEAEERAHLAKELAAVRAAQEAAGQEAETLRTRLAEQLKEHASEQEQLEKLSSELVETRMELETAQKERGVIKEEKARLAKEWERWQREHADVEKQRANAAVENAKALEETRAKLSALQAEFAMISSEGERRETAPPKLAETKNGTPPAPTLPPSAPLPKPPKSLPMPPPEPAKLETVLSTAPRLSSWLRRGPKGKAAMVDEPPEAQPAGAAAPEALAPAAGTEQTEAIDPGTQFPLELVKQALGDSPRAVMTMRNSLQYFIRHPRDLKLLTELLTHVKELGKRTESIPNHPVQRLGRSVETLVNDCIELPELITKSTLRTLTQSLDFLAVVLEEKNLSRLYHLTAPRVLNVDDDPMILEQVGEALKLSGLPVKSSENPGAALELMKTQRYDLLVLDVNMPGMNGLELCAKVRNTPNYQKVPIIFLTAAATAQNRAQSLLLGGNDLIGKPFVMSELGLKARMWIYKGQLGLI